MNKLNLTEAEKNRIRGLHGSYRNEHGTLIKEGPTGARYGLGFEDKEDDMAETTVTPPGDWTAWWETVKSMEPGNLFLKLNKCNDKSLKDWMAKNTSCAGKMNFLQDENCMTSFQEVVNLTSVLACLGVETIKDLGSKALDWFSGSGS
tara:strand:+ start:3382 stop:3825 length:444 start_codon:yes stop_codon:yes gene_type:complete